MYLRELGLEYELYSADLAQKPTATSCEHSKEPSVSIKCCEFLEWLSKWWFLEESAPWSWKSENREQSD
jgi:hypothetical protein